MAEIWWNMKLAAPAAEYWKQHGHVERGEFGGHCNHPACRHASADWYNKGSGKYYCRACADAINEMCLRQGEQKLCEMHF